MLSFDTIAADGRGAVRSLRKRPGYAAACIATLALGIGATAAVFTVVDSVLLERLPYPGAERIGILWHELHHGAQVLPIINPLDFRDYQERSRSFEAMTLGIGAERVLAGSGNATNVDVGRVLWNFLHFFDGQPHLGRFFDREEDVYGGPKVAVLSHELWRAKFGADPGGVISLSLGNIAFRCLNRLMGNELPSVPP